LSRGNLESFAQPGTDWRGAHEAEKESEFSRETQTRKSRGDRRWLFRTNHEGHEDHEA